jgi:HD-like signal output (HDOD) protein
MEKAILLVDDEKQILKSFSRLFQDSAHTIHLAESAREALDILMRHPVDMVISDMRMPDMDGYALLREVKHLYPHTIRLILSGYTDERIIFDALQNNLAKLHLFKPWNNEELLGIINRILDAEEELKQMRLFEAINGLDDLPAHLTTYNRLTKLIERDAGMDEIAAVIESDPAVTTRLLRIANSAFYGTATGSVRQAISFLGLINVRNIVLSSSIFESAPHDLPVRTRMELLWRQAALTSRIMLLIYQHMLRRKPTGDILSAGLLHDIGKMITLARFPDRSAVLFEDPEQRDTPWHDKKETALFGSTHTDIGAYLLNWWGLPFALMEASRYHHIPEDPRVVNRELVSVIHLADCLAWELLGMPPRHGINPFALHQLGLDIEPLRALVDQESDSLLSQIP